MKLYCLAFVLFLACTKTEPDRLPAKADSFKQVYEEYLLLSAGHNVANVRTREPLDSLLQAFQLSRGEFDSIRTWYQNHPAAFESFTAAVTKGLQARTQKKQVQE